MTAKTNSVKGYLWVFLRNRCSCDKKSSNCGKVLSVLITQTLKQLSQTAKRFRCVQKLNFVFFCEVLEIGGKAIFVNEANVI